MTKTPNSGHQLLCLSATAATRLLREYVWRGPQGFPASYAKIVAAYGHCAHDMCLALDLRTCTSRTMAHTEHLGIQVFVLFAKKVPWAVMIGLWRWDVNDEEWRRAGGSPERGASQRSKIGGWSGGE